MCDTNDHRQAARSTPSRRTVLAGATAAAATALLPLRATRASAALKPANNVGQRAYRAAAHLHGSGSEGPASWHQHFDQAVLNSFDVVVPTDHDWRVQLRNYGGEFHFADWRQPTPSGHYELRRRSATPSLTTDSGGTLVSPASPKDATAGARSLRLVAASSSNASARLVYEWWTKTSNQDINGTVLGRQLKVDVRVDSLTSRKSNLSLAVTLSRDPVHGTKTLTYRLRTDLSTAPPPVVVGSAATIDVPLTRGAWTTVAPDLVVDIRRCWPSITAEDNAIGSIQLKATGSKTERLEALVSFLRLVADPAYDPLTDYDAMLARASARHPSLLVPTGLEHSVHRHIGQIGGRRFFYPYPGNDPSTHAHFTDAVAVDQATQIRSHGGFATYNHPAGTSDSAPTGAARQTAINSIVAKTLRNRIYGCDGFEVGYVRRGLDLSGHLEVFDGLCANGVFTTAMAVTDDHSGVDWAAQTNRGMTLPWMSSLSEAALLTALRGGRASLALLGDFDGGIDLSIDGVARMGQAYAVTPSAGQRLVVECYGAPKGSTMRVLSGVVDHGGVSFTRPTELALVPASALAAPVALRMPTAPPCYYRAELVDAAGDIIAFTNPIWHLPAGASAPSNRLVRG